MAQFFFHIRAGAVRISDEEGLDFRDRVEALGEMRASARDLALASIRSGGGVDSRIIELEDARGNVLETLPIRSVLH